MNSKKAGSIPGPARVLNGGIKKSASPCVTNSISRKLPPGPSAFLKKSPSHTPQPAPRLPPLSSSSKSASEVQRDAWRSETIYKIIDLIKSDERPFRFSEVQLHVNGTAWQKDAVLMKSLREKANVEVDEKGENVQYKWKYTIKCHNDLLAILRTQKGVVDLDELAANTSYKQLYSLTIELAKNGWIKILDRQKGSDAPKSIYYDPWSQSEDCRNVTISDADRDLWQSIKIDPEKVEEELKKMELTSITVPEKLKPKQTTEQGKKKRKNKSRAVKLVNTHLNLDWAELLNAKTK